MSELRPCPFCDVNEWKYQSHFSGTTIYQCEKCGTIVEEWVINIRPIEDALHARIAELESLVDQLIWVGNDLLVSNTNPVTITLFNGLVCNAKERER